MPMMKLIAGGLLATLFCSLLLVLPVSASPQQPDLLILDGDTVAIYQLPLGYFLRQDEENYYWHMRRSEQQRIASNNWRGYRAIWTIEDDGLWLQDLMLVSPDPFGLSDEEAKERILRGSLTSRPIFASWYSGKIIVPAGDLLRWDGVFERTFTTEVLYTFDQGHLTSVDTVSNYLQKRNAINRLYSDDLNALMLEPLRRLNWTRLHRLECDDAYEVVIGANGRVRKVKHDFHDLVSLWSEPGEWLRQRRCSTAIARALKHLRFDIIRCQGRPIEESVLLDLYFDEETNTLHDFAIVEFDGLDDL
jgi:hypothetical protein